jgi:protoporphyrinogen oxidase
LPLRAGSRVKTERIDGFVIDAGPDALLTHKPAAIDLCRELGMCDRLRPPMQRDTFVVRGGALPEASACGIPVDWFPFVTSRRFSLRGKRSSDAIVARAHREVGRLLGVTGDPLLARVYRWPHASAQQEVGHPALMARIENRLAAYPRLFISAAGFRGMSCARCIAGLAPNDRRPDGATLE